MIALLLSAALEVSLAPPRTLPLQTGGVRSVASSGDELLAAWIDSRDRAIHAVRVTAEPRVIGEEIRIEPPRKPYTVYENPVVAATSRGYVLAFTRREGKDNKPEVLVTGLARDGTRIDREPVVIGAGTVVSAAANGTSILVTWAEGDDVRGRLFTEALDPMGTVAKIEGQVAAITPRRDGYLLTLFRDLWDDHKTSIVRLGSDGQLGAETIIGRAHSVAVTDTPEGALLLYTNSVVHDAVRGTHFIDFHDALVSDSGQITARHDLGRCESEHGLVTGVAPYDRGFLATALCAGTIQPATLPPLPVYNFYTVVLGPRGERNEIRLAAEKTEVWNLVTLGRSVYTVVADRTANIARVAPGRLFEPLVFSVGEPDKEAQGLVRTKEGVIAFWRSGIRNTGPQGWGMWATHVRADGADPANRARLISKRAYAVTAEGGRILALEGNSARILTTNGEELGAFPVDDWKAASDGRHWIVYHGMKHPGHMVRTALDGSDREETSFETKESSWLSCNEHGCLIAWTEYRGEISSAYIRADRPLASARARSIAGNGYSQTGGVGAASDAFLIVTSRTDGTVRASIVSATTGEVTAEVPVATFPSGQPPGIKVGGGDDGFEVVLTRYTEEQGYFMEVVRIDRNGGARRLDTIPGMATDVIRSGGRGYILTHRGDDLVVNVTE